MKSHILGAAVFVAVAASSEAQVQTIKKLPPAGTVSTVNLPPPKVQGEVRIIPETRDPNVPVAANLPDLVIREVRQEEPGSFGIHVANLGPTPAGPFTIMLTVTTATGSKWAPFETTALAGGSDAWVKVTLERVDGKVTKMKADADPTYMTAEFGRDPSGNINPSRWMWVTVKSRVKESDETNNSLESTVPPA